jgi:hypothetical protein
LVALGISAAVRALIEKTPITDWITRKYGHDSPEARRNAARPIAKAVFYLLMLLVLVGCFQILGLTLITEPLNNLLNQVFSFAPNLIAAAALLAVALIAAGIVRALLRTVLDSTRLDDRLQDRSGVDATEAVPLSRSVSEAAYWLILLLFTPAILGALGLAGLLAPVQNLVDNLLGYLPNLLAGGLVLLVGWFVARIVQRVVTNLLAAAGADNLGERIGLDSALGQRSEW